MTDDEPDRYRFLIEAEIKMTTINPSTPSVVFSLTETRKAYTAIHAVESFYDEYDTHDRAVVQDIDRVVRKQPVKRFSMTDGGPMNRQGGP
jgi:RNA:NAD 2'-phosphotransferase (TPT1/KptA family)